MSAQLWALEPATFQSPGAVALHGDAAPLIPLPMFVIEHAEGLVLFDAGLDPSCVGDPAAGYGEVADRIRLTFDERHLIDPFLKARGHSIADVTHVIASHLHWDHIGGLKQFPHARIVVGKGEQEYAAAPEKFAADFYRPEDFGEPEALELEEISGDWDVFGDGSIVALRMPGHTPGSLALQVKSGERTIVLSGDVVHTRGAYEEEIHYHGDVDSVQARQSLRRLKGVLAEHQADLWIAHDPVDWERFGGAGRK